MREKVEDRRGFMMEGKEGKIEGSEGWVGEARLFSDDGVWAVRSSRSSQGGVSALDDVSG